MELEYISAIEIGINLDQFNQIKNLMNGGQVSQFNYDLKTFNCAAGMIIEPKYLNKKMLKLQDLTFAENKIQIYISDNQVKKIMEIIR